MVLQFLAKDESLDTLVISEQGDHVLEEEALTIVKEVQGGVDFGVDVVGDNVVQVDQFSTKYFTMPHQSRQLKKVGSCHQLQDVSAFNLDLAKAAVVQIGHDQVEDVVPLSDIKNEHNQKYHMSTKVPDIVDLKNGWIAFTESGIEHRLEPR